jgi:hypothetical protein
MSPNPRETTVTAVPAENIRERKPVLATDVGRHEREELPVHCVDDIRPDQDAEGDDPEDTGFSARRVDSRY